MRIAVDTGGTFTDFVVLAKGEIKRFKLSSTPDNPATAVARGCAAFAGFSLAHGTTVATNAILEGKTARTGLVVSEGFRDILRLGRQSRPSLYEWEPKRPRLPIADEDVRVVRGGIRPDGSVEVPLDLPEDFGLDDCEAVAICLLFAHANPAQEMAVKKRLRNRFVCASHEVSPEMREYERACATVLNAAVGPIVGEYLSSLASECGAESVEVMSSLGGLISLEDAKSLPIRTVVSGPAGGVRATAALGRRLGRPNTIAFDMGGTSTDVTLVHKHEAAMTDCADIAGLPVRSRRVDVHTIGCGGGSIANIDGAGALRVGPESAGAVPGPGLFGGDLPTVTDANFVLGRLPLTRFVRSEGLDPARSAQVIDDVARALGMSLKDAALAIVNVADSQLAAAVRHVSADRGFRPSGFSLVAFGGSGALHACTIAELLDIEEILVPAGAGVFSALGLLGSPSVWEESRGVLGTDADWEETYHGLARVASRHVENGATSRLAQMRYRGQSHDLAVEADGTREESETAFQGLHRERYGVSFGEVPVEWVTARVRAECGAPDPPTVGVRRRAGSVDDGVIEREALVKETGDMVIIDDDCTIYVPKGWVAEALEDGTIRIYR